MRKIIISLWGLIVLCMMVSCTKGNELLDKRDMIYKTKHIVSDKIQGDVTNFAVWQERIYIHTTQWEEIEEEILDETEEHHLYSMTLDGKDSLEEKLPDVTGTIKNIFFLQDAQTLKLFVESENQGKSSYYIEDFLSGERVEITNALQMNQEENIVRVLLGKKRFIVIVTSKRFVILDEKGEKQTELKTEDNYVQSVARTKEGDVVVAQTTDDKIKIRTLDTEKGEWGTTIKISSDSIAVGDILADGVEYDFYYKDTSGIYGYSEEEKKERKLMDYVSSDVCVGYTDSIVPIGGDKMVGIADVLSNDGAKMILYTKMDASDVKNKQIITFGTTQITESVKDAVMSFNRDNDEYEIQFKDYSAMENPEVEFAKDVASGNIPDVLDLTGMSLRQYVAKGLLEDLTPYYRNDDMVKLEDLLPSVLKAMTVQDKYYYVSPMFWISSLAGKKKDVGTESGWNIEHMMKLAEKYPEAELFYNSTKKEMLHTLISYGINDYVDWNTGMCRFDSESFRFMLELCNKGQNQMGGKEMESEPTAIRNGEVLLRSVSIGAEGFEINKAMFNSEITFIGYPNEMREGTYFVFQPMLCISSQSQNKEGAWEFLRTFMLLGYQGKNRGVDEMMPTTPTRQDAFQMYMRSKIATEQYVDELGAIVEPLQYGWGYDDFEWDVKPLNQEEAEKYVELVNCTTQTQYTETDIVQIVEEEAQAYFEGTRSLDKTIDIIQDRCTKYVNENR